MKKGYILVVLCMLCGILLSGCVERDIIRFGSYRKGTNGYSEWQDTDDRGYLYFDADGEFECYVFGEMRYLAGYGEYSLKGNTIKLQFEDDEDDYSNDGRTVNLRVSQDANGTYYVNCLGVRMNLEMREE